MHTIVSDIYCAFFSFTAFNILVNFGIAITYPKLISLGIVLSVPVNASEFILFKVYIKPNLFTEKVHFVLLTDLKK